MCRGGLRRSCLRFVHGRRPSLNRSRGAKDEQLRPFRSALCYRYSLLNHACLGWPVIACHHFLSVSVTGYRSHHAVYAPSALSKPNSEKHPICGNGRTATITRRFRSSSCARADCPLWISPGLVYCHHYNRASLSAPRTPRPHGGSETLARPWSGSPPVSCRWASIRWPGASTSSRQWV
jgi:hypothetical protein